MTDDDHIYFCTQCGAKLHENDEFCTSCGKSLKGEDEPVDNARIDKPPMVSKNYLTISMIMLAIWTIFAAYVGLSSVLNMDYMIEVLKSDPASWTQLMTIMTEAEIRQILAWVGCMFITSAVFSAVSLVLCATKKYFTIALIACVIAVFASMIFAIIGVFVIYLIYKSKEYFTN